MHNSKLQKISLVSHYIFTSEGFKFSKSKYQENVFVVKTTDILGSRNHRFLRKCIQQGS